MDLKDYIVLKEFLSHNSKRLYQVGDIYDGGNSYHTRQLLRYGFIKEPGLEDTSTTNDCEGCRSILRQIIKELKGEK